MLAPAQARTVRYFGCFVSLMGVLYRVWRDEGEAAGRLANEQCLALPVVWLHETPELLKRAAAIKAGHPLSVGDAWIAASAIEQGAILVHKDPEFKVVPVLQELLPWKDQCFYCVRLHFILGHAASALGFPEGLPDEMTCSLHFRQAAQGSPRLGFGQAEIEFRPVNFPSYQVLAFYHMTNADHGKRKRI